MYFFLRNFLGVFDYLLKLKIENLIWFDFGTKTFEIIPKVLIKKNPAFLPTAILIYRVP